MIIIILLPDASQSTSTRRLSLSFFPVLILPPGRAPSNAQHDTRARRHMYIQPSQTQHKTTKHFANVSYSRQPWIILPPDQPHLDIMARVWSGRRRHKHRHRPRPRYRLNRNLNHNHNHNHKQNHNVRPRTRMQSAGASMMPVTQAHACPSPVQRVVIVKLGAVANSHHVAFATKPG